MVQSYPAVGARRGGEAGAAALAGLTVLALLLSVTLGAVDGSSLGAVVPAYALLGTAALLVADRRLGEVDRTLVGLVVLLLAWMAVATWLAGRGPRGLGRVGQMATVLLPLLMLMPLADRAGPALRRAFPAAAVAGAVVALLLGIELVLDAPVARWIEGRDGTRYNRGLACLIVLAWPVAAAVGPRLALPLLVAVGFMAGASESATARLSFAAGTVAALAGMAVPRLARAGLAAGVTAVSLGAPWIFARIEAAVPVTGRIPPSWIERLDIWREAQVLILQAPLSGHGLRMLRDAAAASLPPVVALFTHLHNVFLQVWLDLGAVGAALALAVALRLLWSGSRLPAGQGPFALAAWTSALVAVMSGFEIWSEAMLGAFAFAAFLFAAPARAAAGR